MNLVRFMSTRELYRFLDGETISGNTEWRREGYASSSKGICFFPADPKPETRLHYLSGECTLRRCVIALVTRSWELATSKAWRTSGLSVSLMENGFDVGRDRRLGILHKVPDSWQRPTGERLPVHKRPDSREQTGT